MTKGDRKNLVKKILRTVSTKYFIAIILNVNLNFDTRSYQDILKRVSVTFCVQIVFTTMHTFCFSAHHKLSDWHISPVHLTTTLYYAV